MNKPSATAGRETSYGEAIREGFIHLLSRHREVFTIGQGLWSPWYVGNSMTDLDKLFGKERVIDTPVSELACTGAAVGAALCGYRPVVIHPRMDFMVLAADQIVNQAAKWNYMFGGQQSAPMVIRLVVGRGWGQGPQHSQSLQSWFAHIPGLKVIMPATPYDAKGMMIAAIEDNNPVISIEHRWLYNIKGKVPEDHYTVPLGAPNIARRGADVTIAAASYMTIEALEAANDLAEEGIEAEVIDIRTLNPFDDLPLVESVKKTGRLIVADTGHRSVGFAAEVVARVSEQAFGDLVAPPVRIALPDVPTPTTRALANYYYPRKFEITAAARRLTGLPEQPMPEVRPDSLLDVPDRYFRGPF